MTRSPSRSAALDRVAGAVTAVLVVAVALFAYAFYKGVLTPGVEVELRTDRAGLLLDAGSAVSVRGVRVGSVRAVTSEDGQARIKLSLDPDQAAALPANVSADLRPTTLFGAKYVDLVLPAKKAAEPLRDGDVIGVQPGSQEADQVFQNVMNLLDDVQPEKINETLTAVSGALRGRGETIGQTVEKFNTYLVGILPSMDTFGRDLQLANQVVPTYQQAAPDLIDALDDFRTTSATLTQQGDQIGTMLSTLTEAGGETTALMIDAGPPLTDATKQLAPTTKQLARYSPMLTCLLQGMVNLTEAPSLKSPIRYPGVWGNVGLLPPARVYQYPADLPKVAADTGPACYGLPLVSRNTPEPHYDFDVGRSPYKNGVSVR